MHVTFAVLMLMLVLMFLSFVHMRLEGTALANGQKFDAGSLGQFNDGRPGSKGLECIGQKQFHAVAGPEDDVGRFECSGIGWLERIGVGRGRALDDERRFIDAGHDGSHQRMDRLDRGNHIGRRDRRRGQQGRAQEGEGGEQFHQRPRDMICYVITLAALLCYNVLKAVKGLP